MVGSELTVGLVHGSGFEILPGNIYVPSEVTRANANVAGDLLAKGIVKYLILSGRGSIAGQKHGHTEASLMWDLLVDRGIPKRLLVPEEESTSTVANWSNSSLLLEDMGAEEVVGVASAVHAPRAQRVGVAVAERSSFELQGYKASISEAGLRAAAKELGLIAFTEVFLALNRKTAAEEMGVAYDRFKATFGIINPAKRLFYGKANT